MGPGTRWLVPTSYPLVGSVPINRPVIDDKLVDEPLLGLLPPVDPNLVELYGPSTWGPEAYATSFDKFEYGQCDDFFSKYPEMCEFADWAFYRHFAYLQDSIFVNMMATEKNQDSTPAYPKMMRWSTEADYLSDCGWRDYILEFDRIKAGARPKVCWYLFLKKEILKQEKIDKHDIRQIVCSDPIYARIGCFFEQHQNARMKTVTESSSGQCGWSPFYGGFEQRVRRLESKGNHYYIEFDWTRFDGTIPVPLFMHIKKLRFSLFRKDLRDQYASIYRWYCKQLLNRYVVLPSGEVTIQRKGNPSGQISTTTDNNMVNYWLQAFEFAYLNGPDRDLWDRYDTLIYGDDRLTTTPVLPSDYVNKVVKMYKDVFGMWVKPEKVIVQPSPIGLSFCGFEINPDYLPVPSQPYKMMASLLKPANKLHDVSSLHGKLLCFQLLMHNAPDDHPFKEYLERCLVALRSHSLGSGLPYRFTEEQLDYIWRGGPKQSYG